ncbi:hypothetical protein JAAARDRAFT_685395 [Jaapia argillacea MUCL 33604]|uniref:Extracellular metalloproteinase n=1 Tax=Jaapia argillacea MUCL 33604 TaxID=933084 RepID=A0A067PSX7_9AGAM|nr:hypothetical protein JAAARDRAFT_685395 [Jaapia argillacea MUCL 33604]
MRCILAASLAVATLAGRVLAHQHVPISSDDDLPSVVRRRKTLGFGPVHPHAVYKSSPYDIPVPAFLPAEADADPELVVRAFVRDLLERNGSGDSDFVIRKDSYQDKATGVSHFYVRQIVNGLEVVDGDINVNYKDGIVLSYGDSFYRGQAPSSLIDDSSDLLHPHAEYCSQLSYELNQRWQFIDRYLASQDEVHVNDGSIKASLIGDLEHIHESNCGFVSLPYELAHKSSNGFDFDARNALLQFMIAATPNSEVVQDILSKYDQYVEGMSSTFERHLVAGEEAMVEMINNVPDTVNPVKAKLAYIQVPDGESTKLQLVWRFEVEMQDNWYETAVSAFGPHRIISVVDWASDSPVPKPPTVRPAATYNVFGWGINDPSVGSRSIEKEYFDSLASPIGWHSLPVANDPLSQGRRSSKGGKELANYTTTWGNNVFAHENWEGRNSWENNYRPDAGADLVFNYTYNPKETGSEDALAEAKKYINTTVTQLFYTSNMVHDLYYRYGFDEVSGNFQQHNFGRGGAENDAVIANAQDGSGYNNANFMTPPDGQNGRCRMYVWNTAMPYRDGDLEAGIVIHELSHGLSTRLTGGPANSGCLGWGESGGMGEGWGDFLATTIRSNKTYSDYAMGAWAANQEKGIRNFIYSTNETVNPSTYKTLDKPGYWGVHAIGEVWAQILWVVSQDLIKKHGYADNLFPPAPLADGTIPEGDFYRPQAYTASGQKKPLVPKHGNSLMVQLVLNGMKLQACRPSFFEARDAIIQADQILTDGENFCTLWAGFASRGLGPDAKVEGRTPWGGGVRTNVNTLCYQFIRDIGTDCDVSSGLPGAVEVQGRDRPRAR